MCVCSEENIYITCIHIHAFAFVFTHVHAYVYGLILYMYRYTRAYLYVPMGNYRCIYEYTDLKVKTH